MVSKKQLAIKLSKLHGFSNPKEHLEQYESDSEIIAEVLWHLQLSGKLGSNIGDYGAGTGIIGIGCIYLESNVSFIENDEDAIKDLKHNLKGMPKKYKIIQENVLLHNKQYDTIVMNPPFGTRQKGMDKEFLQHGMLYSDAILSMHKTSTKTFIKKFVKEAGFQVTFEWDVQFPIKAKYSHHKKKIDRKEVTVLFVERIK